MQHSSVPSGKQSDQSMDMDALTWLMHYIQQHNLVNSPNGEKGTPRIRQIIPHVDPYTQRIDKIEFLHGRSASRKNFEVRYTPSDQTMYQHIVSWLQSKLIPRDVLMQQRQTKIGTPEDPFYIKPST